MQRPDFTGEWALNVEASSLSPVVAPVVQSGFVSIQHREPTVSVHLCITMDGKPFDVQFERPSVWDGDTLVFTDKVSLPNGEMTICFRYELQDDGFDTIDANEQLGFDADERIYAPAATMLSRMGIKRVRLMTNNPEKISQLERYGIEVAERVAHSFPANGHNENYLRTKAERAGHML